MSLVLPSSFAAREPLSASPGMKLNTARLQALARQIPLLALVIAGNTLALSAIVIQSAPIALTLSAPAALLFICIVAAMDWRHVIDNAIDEDEAREILRRVNYCAGALAFVFTVWAAALYLFADASERYALVYGVSVAGMFSIFALARLPRTALLIGGMSLPAFAYLTIMAGDAASIVAGVNIFVVLISLFRSVNRSSDDFEALVAAQAEAAQLAEDNRRLAETDSLTTLWNRRAFFNRIAAEIARGPEAGALAMGVVDLDGFKPVNDLYGHALGDEVLRECAERLKFLVDQGAVIARLGGDEFGVFQSGLSDELDILAFGAQICAALKTPVRLADADATIAASIGFARFPGDAADAHQLYERADYALYFAKQHHRGEAVLFHPDHEEKMRVNAQIEQCLRRADLEKEIHLEFQPLFDVAEQSIVSFEALARWNSPELGAVTPSVFIPVAERSDIIHPLTRTVLRKALKAARNWPAHVGVSFNLSVRDLLSPRALPQILAIIESSGVDTSRIDIEVTETALLTDFEQAEEALIRLKRLGVKISLDDFGTGYSSLSYMHRLPLDKIKIDRSFIQEMHGNGVARDIVKSMIGLIGNLNLHCVTEGVETSEQFDLLRNFGCNVVQGFLFSRPIPQDEVENFIAEAEGRRSLARRA